MEPIDPVRYLSNHSSGKMGYAIATSAVEEGSEVILISGPTDLDVPSGITFVGVRTAAEMDLAVREYLPQCEVGVFTAAVCDYRVKNYASQKMKKKEGVDVSDVMLWWRMMFLGTILVLAVTTIRQVWCLLIEWNDLIK